jgi:beta-mannanase
MDRGFKSGFLWGQEGYQEFSRVWGKFADSIKDQAKSYK